MNIENSYFISPVLNTFLAMITGWLSAKLVNHLADLFRINLSNKAKNRPVFVYIILVASSLWISLLPSEHYNSPFGRFLALLMMAYLVLIAVIDYENRVVFNWTSLFGLFYGLVFGAWRWGFTQALLGGVIGLLSMAMIYIGGKAYLRLTKKIRSNDVGNDAIGSGDVFLAGILGLFLGIDRVLPGIMLTFGLAGAFGLVSMIFSMVQELDRNRIFLPLGSFTALSIYIIIFFK